MKYFKILNSEENHHGLQYHDGLNIDILTFAEKGSCVPGGIYFTDISNICLFLGYGQYIREVTIPEDARMVKDPEGNKWRADRIILGERHNLQEADTWKWLIEQGLDIHSDNEWLLMYACYYGYLEVVKYIVESGINMLDYHLKARQFASQNGFIEIVEYINSLKL